MARDDDPPAQSHVREIAARDTSSYAWVREIPSSAAVWVTVYTSGSSIDSVMSCSLSGNTDTTIAAVTTRADCNSLLWRSVNGKRRLGTLGRSKPAPKRTIRETGGHERVAHPLCERKPAIGTRICETGATQRKSAPREPGATTPPRSAPHEHIRDTAAERSRLSGRLPSFGDADKSPA